MAEELNWISAREMYAPNKKSIKPPVDHIISDIVGYDVYLTDPRILQVVTKWKRSKKGNEDTPDNFLENPQFIKEIREIFTKPL